MDASQSRNRSYLFVRLAWSILCICLIGLAASRSRAGSDMALPESISVVTGVPLTIPQSRLQEMGLEPHQNTGGWGDVMANVVMAHEIKRRFPAIRVRLLVTLNDRAKSPFVNRVRSLVPKIFSDAQGRSQVDPDVLEAQEYRGLEVYFVSLPDDVLLRSSEDLSPEQREQLKVAVAHVPQSSVGVQFSANNKPVNELVFRASEMRIHFNEYTHDKRSLVYAFLHESVPSLKLNSGPHNFGVYGFGAEQGRRGSAQNIDVIRSWLASLGLDKAAEWRDTRFMAGQAELAFAYAGDAGLVEDYVEAVRRRARLRPHVRHIVVAKGSGSPTQEGNVLYIPLGHHSRELAHALIAESTVAPLVTGDGSLSSALATLAGGDRPKGLLYEAVAWKRPMMESLLREVAGSTSKEEQERAAAILIEPNSKADRRARVIRIGEVIEDQSTARLLYAYFDRRKSRLDMVNNLVTVTRLRGLIRDLTEMPGVIPDAYLGWLVDKIVLAGGDMTTVEANLRETIERTNVRRDRARVVEVWFSLVTLWALGRDVRFEIENKAARDFVYAFEARNTEKVLELKAAMPPLLNQIDGLRFASGRMRDLMARDDHFATIVSRFQEEFEMFNSRPFPWLSPAQQVLRCEDIW